MKYLVIITVFMVSTLMACATKEVDEESKDDREILTFAKIAKDIEADREKAKKTYVGKVVTIRAKIEDIAGLKEEILEFSAYPFKGSDFVSFWVGYYRDDFFHLKDDFFDPFFHQYGDSEDSNFYLFRVRVKNINPTASIHHWVVWMELNKWHKE